MIGVVRGTKRASASFNEFHNLKSLVELNFVLFYKAVAKLCALLVALELSAVRTLTSSFNDGRRHRRRNNKDNKEEETGGKLHGKDGVMEKWREDGDTGGLEEDCSLLFL
jgi:hypothetical protein